MRYLPILIRERFSLISEGLRFFGVVFYLGKRAEASFQDITDGSIDVGDRIVGVTNESGFHEIGPDHDQEAEELAGRVEYLEI